MYLKIYLVFNISNSAPPRNTIVIFVMHNHVFSRICIFLVILCKKQDCTKAPGTTYRPGGKQ